MRHLRNLAIVAFAATALLAPSLVWAQASAQFTPSRTSGVAPLAVFLDATGSSAPGADPIHNLAYEWSFGDPTSGTWSISGESKDEATGPWASHVFEKTGTYTISLVVTAPNGSQSVTTRTINVSDPDAYFSGTKTVCVSTSGAFAGCPAGAQHVTTSNFNVGASHRGTGKRVLFRRGESFTAGSKIKINAPGPATIGAFGTGAQPAIQTTASGAAFDVSGKTPLFTDWRIMDLSFTGSNIKYSSVLGADGTTKQFLMLRVSGTQYHTGLTFPPSVINFYGQKVMSDDIAIVECNFNDMNGGGGGNGVYIGANRLAFLGNTIVDTENSEHVVRVPYVGAGVFSHNFLSRPAGGKVILKLHAVGASQNKSYSERDSHDILISHNVFQGGRNDWGVNLGPQNQTTDERVRDGIIEKNYFLAGPRTRVHLLLWASNVSVRNNIFNMNGGSRWVAASITRRGIEPPPTGNNVYNNTCYTSDAATSASCASATSVASNTTALNNLVFAPNAASVGGLGTTRAPSNPFVASLPSSPADFRLSQTSSAVDAGSPVSWLGADFSGSARPTDGDQNGSVQWDLGAFELGGSGGTIPPAAPAAPVLLP